MVLKQDTHLVLIKTAYFYISTATDCQRRNLLMQEEIERMSMNTAVL
jgi:hypothetical protein